MKKTLLNIIVAGVTASGACAASATVVQTFGFGSAVQMVTNAAAFDLNTSLSNNYAEGGLLFQATGSGQNNGCGYAGIDCYDLPSELSPSFEGNYLATAGNNAYISIRKGDGSDFYNIEFAVGSGYLSLFGHWKSFNNALLTGSGNFSQADGNVLGLSDSAGFDEIRYFAFSSPGQTAGWSAAAIDQVRVGVPEPGSFALFGAALAGMAGVRRRRARVSPGA
jgi:hypothetical protein